MARQSDWLLSPPGEEESAAYHEQVWPRFPPIRWDGSIIHLATHPTPLPRSRRPPPSPQLLARRSPPLPVCVRLDAGGGRGKGVFATRDIEEGELIFAERPLVRGAVALIVGGLRWRGQPRGAARSALLLRPPCRPRPRCTRQTIPNLLKPVP
jgi:hypothetical protein